MKQIITMLLLAMLLASPVMAMDAPAMWTEQNDGGLALMVNTSEVSYGANAWIHFDSECINVTNVTMTGPYEPLEGYGWSQHLNCMVMALTNFDGVAIGEYQVAQIDVECVADNCTSDIGITRAEPIGVIAYNGTFVCEVAEEIDVDTTISIGQCRGISSLPIVVENVTNLGSCDITLSYNPLVVKVVDVQGREMDFVVVNTEHVDDGWVRIGAIQTENLGMSGDAVIAQVFFEPIGDGASTLVLSNTMLTDASPGCVKIEHVLSHGKYYAPRQGDVDDDGVVDVADVVYIMRYVLGATGYETIDTALADVNSDGVVTISDAMYLARHLLGVAGFETLPSAIC